MTSIAKRSRLPFQPGQHADGEHRPLHDLTSIRGLTERSEVVGPEEMFRSRSDRIHVEIVFDEVPTWRNVFPPILAAKLPSPFSKERVALTADVHEISVSLVGGMKSWVVTTKARLRVLDDDVIWQSGVEAMDPALPGHVVRAPKARQLTERMHARIRAAAPLDRRMLEPHLIDSLLDHPLDGPKSGLRLPAMEIGAVVAEAQANAIRKLQLLDTHLSPAGR